MISNFIEKLHTYGLKGCFDYIQAKISSRKITTELLRNARKYPLTPERGVTIVADLGGNGSLCKVMRDLAFNLKDCKIPFQTFDLSEGRTVPDQDIIPILTPRSEFRMCRYDHVIEMFTNHVPELPGIKRSRIVFWEFESGLLEMNPKLNDGVEIIAMSDFTYDIFRKAFPSSTSVRKILYPFRFEIPPLDAFSKVRARYGIGVRDFVIFYNFDFNSSFNRKNPDGAVKAFAEAFRDITDAKLVFKTMGAKRHPEKLAELNELASKLGIADRFITINNYIPQADLYGLTATCDVYLSLHRGEGFGLGIAEAMSLGKPVIATDYSSTREFCNPQTSIPVPNTLVDVSQGQIDNPCYRFVKTWAEPDIHSAAQALQTLYDGRTLCSQLGTQAQNLIKSHFGLASFQESLEHYLLP